MEYTQYKQYAIDKLRSEMNKRQIVLNFLNEVDNKLVQQGKEPAYEYARVVFDNEVNAGLASSLLCSYAFGIMGSLQ